MGRQLGFPAVVIFFFLVSPLQGYSEIPASKGELAGGRGGPGLVPPERKISAVEIDDFSRAVMSQVVERRRGGVTLQMKEGAWQDEFQAVWRPNNTFHPALSVNSKNQWAIAWVEDRNSTECDIYVRQLDQRTRRIGDDIWVATCPGRAYYQNLGMAIDSKDCIFVIYVTERNGTGRGIYFQRLTPDGERIGAETKIPGSDNATATQYSTYAFAVNSEDRFLIAWNNDNATSDIMAAILSSDGTAPVTNITIQRGAGYQGYLSVTAAKDGRFIVVWDDYSLNWAGCARIVGGNGAFVGDLFQVSGPGPGYFGPMVAAGSENDFLIAGFHGSGNPPWDILAQRIDTNGTRVGQAVTLANNCTGGFAMTVNSSSSILLVNYPYKGDGYRMQWSDPGGHKVGNETCLMTNTSIGGNPRVAVNTKDDVIVAWEQNVWGIVYARQYLKPYVSSGYLETEDISPQYLWSWVNLSNNLSLPGFANNSIQFTFSTDGGNIWHPVPANGSLAGAGTAERLRLRASFSTTDEMTSPTLHNITLRYVSNRPPIVALPPDITMWKNNGLDITANASDADGDDLIYTWAQTSGPDLGLAQTTGQTISVWPTRSGAYGLQVVVDDGYNTSLPARINLTVMNRPPVAVLTADPTSVLAGTPIIFDASRSSDADDIITSYSYNFSDGDSGGWVTNRSIRHIFSAPGRYRANLSVMDIEGAVAGSADLNISVCAPDLAINRSDISILPKGPEEGNRVVFTVKIHNRGDWQAGDFSVRFLIDGKTFAEDVLVNGLAMGASFTVNRTWTAGAGNHKLTVSIDPDHTLTEFNLSNNGATADFSVTRAPSTGISQQSGCGAIILIGVIAAIIILLWMRRRPKATVAQVAASPNESSKDGSGQVCSFD